MAGSGVWLLTATAAMLAAIWVLKVLLDAIAKVGNTEGPSVDPLEDELWHRYEEGDLTLPEFERLRRKRAA